MVWGGRKKEIKRDQSGVYKKRKNAKKCNIFSQDAEI